MVFMAEKIVTRSPDLLLEWEAKALTLLLNFKRSGLMSILIMFKSSLIRIGAIIVGISSLALPLPVSSTVVREQRTNSSIADTAISFDFFGLFKGAVQYVQIANISDEQEVEIGKQIQQQLLSQQYELYDNQQVQEYVDSIGQELVNSADSSRDIPYSFQVVVSDAVNAFATPGGFIYVTTGLLQEADNKAQLASVVAHEIAHINEKHSVRALKRAAIAQGVAETAGVSTNTLAQIGYQLAVNLPQSREYEYEADRVGLDILEQAGYPPMAFVNFLKQLQGGNQPEFLRTHPTSTSRIEALAQEIEASQVSSNKGLDEADYQNNLLSLL
jgi:predicted Zn-dependent protease